MIFAAVSSGRSDLAISSPTKREMPASQDAGDGLDGGAATAGGHGVEAGAAHGDHLDRGAGLHGGDGVAGIDRPLEGVGADYLDDLGDLVDVEQRGHARQDVLAVGGGRGQHVAVTAALLLHQLHDQRRDVFRQLVGIGGAVGDQYLGHAGDLGGGFGHRAAALTGNQQMDVATDLLRQRPRCSGWRRPGRRCCVRQ